MQPRVLVIDDERAIRRFLQTALTAQGYTVEEAVNGKEGIAAVATLRPDVILLDLGLPDMDGVTVAQRIREWSPIPIIVLSVREKEGDKIAALDAGADDYLTKPFGVGELMARMRVAMRRNAPVPQDATFTVGALSVDLAKRVVKIGENEVSLTPTEYDILRLLVNHAGKVITHTQLLRQVWGPGYEEEAHMLRVNISNLRKKIEPDAARPRYIITEPGVGYRLKEE
jgi:two-component system KDP operon response regulator KdpE